MRRRCSRLDRGGGATVRQGRLSGNRDLFRGGERLAGSGIGLGKAGHCECGEHQISEGHILAVHERSYLLEFFVAVRRLWRDNDCHHYPYNVTSHYVEQNCIHCTLTAWASLLD